MLMRIMPSPATTTELRVTGMTCNNCARHVTEAIQSVTGVHSASVSARRWTRQRPLERQPEMSPPCSSAIAKAGYEVKVVEAAQDHGGQRRSRWQWNLILGLSVTGVLMTRRMDF